MATRSGAVNSDGPMKISKRIEKELHQTKVVIRRLPPDFTEEKLMAVLADLPPHNYFYFASADSSLGDLACSRAYFSFIDEASIIQFRDKYDGLYLESEKGLKYRAVVEFAPYQGIPKKRKKADARMATIESDVDYLGFIETPNEMIKPPSMTELAAYIDSIGTDKIAEVQRTPLIDFLIENHKRGGRSGKRSKTGDSAKKKFGKEPSRSKEKRKDGEGTKESKGKKESPKEHSERKKDERSSARDGTQRGYDKTKEKGQDKRGKVSYEENGSEGERKSKVRNKDRPDQVIYTPRGKGRDGEAKESGRGSRDGSYHQHNSSDHYSKNSSERGSEKPHRNHSWDDYNGGSKERGGGRRSNHGYRKTRDSYGDDRAKTHGGGTSYREK